jgi:hypothetical protein
MTVIFWNAFWSAASAIISIVGTIYVERRSALQKVRREQGPLMDACCLWLEQFVDTSEGHFALGTFYLGGDRQFHYDGTRFKRDGTAIYHWTSRSLFRDEKLGVIVYSYEYNYLESPAKPNELGLGKVEYTHDAGGLRFVKGAFSDRGSGQWGHTEMYKFKNLPGTDVLTEKGDPASRIELGRHLAGVLQKQRDAASTI